MKKKLYIILIFCLISLEGISQTTNYHSYSLCMYNFLKYCKWDEVSETEDYKIIIYGKNPVTAELEKIVNGRTVNGRKIRVIETTDLSTITFAHIIYIPDNKSSNLKEISANAVAKSTLIITEREGLVKKGASISFIILDNDKLRFQLNSQEMSNKKVKMAQAMLAMVVTD